MSVRGVLGGVGIEREHVVYSARAGLRGGEEDCTPNRRDGNTTTATPAACFRGRHSVALDLLITVGVSGRQSGRPQDLHIADQHSGDFLAVEGASEVYRVT